MWRPQPSCKGVAPCTPERDTRSHAQYPSRGPRRRHPVSRLAASACGGGSSTGGGSNDSPKELTYWASNQGASIEVDKKVLQPELDKFEKQTGIKVKPEVAPWSDLLNRILTATTSGQGPDVLNIGNTRSASLRATGALLPRDAKNFDRTGGKDRFVDSTGVEGQDPAAVPLYSMAYALHWLRSSPR